MTNEKDRERVGLAAFAVGLSEAKKLLKITGIDSIENAFAYGFQRALILLAERGKVDADYCESLAKEIEK